MKKTVLGVLLLSPLIAGRPAHAQNLADQISGTTFGNVGQVAVSADFDVRFLHADGVSTLLLAPAVDYFLAPQLSIGGQVTFRYVNYDPGSDSSFGLAPRVGYNIPLTPLFSLYPRAGIYYEHNSYSRSVGSDSNNLLGLFLTAPFLFHPVPHFFIGIGPVMRGAIAGGTSADRFLIIGLESTVGGYFDW